MPSDDVLTAHYFRVLRQPKQEGADKAEYNENPRPETHKVCSDHPWFYQRPTLFRTGRFGNEALTLFM